MLQSIRYLKLSSWEESFCNSIEKIRGEELKGLSKMQTVFIGRSKFSLCQKPHLIEKNATVNNPLLGQRIAVHEFCSGHT